MLKEGGSMTSCRKQKVSQELETWSQSFPSCHLILCICKGEPLPKIESACITGTNACIPAPLLGISQ